LDLSYEADQQLRERTFEALLQEEQIIRGLPEKYAAASATSTNSSTYSIAPTP
jgi:hypothetical protein